VSNVIAAISPALRSRRQFWRVMAWLAAMAIVLTVLAFDGYRFLYGT
jgi:hypothetical protein